MAANCQRQESGKGAVGVPQVTVTGTEPCSSNIRVFPQGGWPCTATANSRQVTGEVVYISGKSHSHQWKIFLSVSSSLKEDCTERG